MISEAPLVVVAEDEPLASMALRAQLEALDYRVLGPARDGEEAVALGRCFPVSLAIFDFRMPRRNGLEAATILFDAAPTPVVLLSGFDSRSLPDRIPRPPVFASLTKPADLAELRNAIATAAAGFEQWLDAEPERRERFQVLIDQRAAIADALASREVHRPLARTALALLERAEREDRDLLEVVRDFAAGADHD